MCAPSSGLSGPTAVRPTGSARRHRSDPRQGKGTLTARPSGGWYRAAEGRGRGRARAAGQFAPGPGLRFHACSILRFASTTASRLLRSEFSRRARSSSRWASLSLRFRRSRRPAARAALRHFVHRPPPSALTCGLLRTHSESRPECGGVRLDQHVLLPFGQQREHRLHRGAGRPVRIVAGPVLRTPYRVDGRGDRFRRRRPLQAAHGRQHLLPARSVRSSTFPARTRHRVPALRHPPFPRSATTRGPNSGRLDRTWRTPYRCPQGPVPSRQSGGAEELRFLCDRITCGPAGRGPRPGAAGGGRAIRRAGRWRRRRAVRHGGPGRRGPADAGFRGRGSRRPRAG